MEVRELNQSLSILHTEPHPITMIIYYVSLDISYLFVIFTFLQSIKEVEHMKKRAEVENLKNFVVARKTASPRLESTPIRPTTSSQLEPPLYTSTPSQSPSQSLLQHSLPTLTPRSQVYYTECDACRKLERKLEKMEDDILRLKKIVQKVRLILFISRHVFKTRPNSARALLAFPVTYFPTRNRMGS